MGAAGLGWSALWIRLGVGAASVWLGYDLLLGVSAVGRFVARFGAPPTLVGIPPNVVVAGVGWLELTAGVCLLLGLATRPMAAVVAALGLVSLGHAVALGSPLSVASVMHGGVLVLAVALTIAGSPQFGADALLATRAEVGALVPATVPTWLPSLIGVGLGGVFVVAGYLKVTDPSPIVAMIRNDSLVHAFTAWAPPPLVVRGLGVAELLVGIAVISGRLRPWSGYAAAALIVLYLVRLGALTGLTIHGIALLGGAFGIAAHPTGPTPSATPIRASGKIGRRAIAVPRR